MKRVIALLAVVGAAMIAAPAAAQNELKIGKPAPAWNITDAKGIEKTAKLSDYKGKWVVIEIWGVW